MIPTKKELKERLGKFGYTAEQLKGLNFRVLYFTLEAREFERLMFDRATAHLNNHANASHSRIGVRRGVVHQTTSKVVSSAAQPTAAKLNAKKTS